MSEETLQTLDLVAVAKETEGYTPQDLELLLQRAVHANTVQRGHSDQGTTYYRIQNVSHVIDVRMISMCSLSLPPHVCNHANASLSFHLDTICLCSVSLRCVFVVEGLCAGSEGVHSSLAVGGRPPHPEWSGPGEGGGAEGGATAADGHHNAPGEGECPCDVS